MVNDQNQLKLLIIYLIQIKKKVKDQMAEVTISLKPQLVANFTTFNNIESFNTNNCNFKNKWTGYTS